MENKHNQNLIVLTEDFTKNGILYPIGTNAEIIGIWSGKKEDKMEMAIRINDVIIEEIEQIRYRKLYPESYKDIVGWFDFQDIYDCIFQLQCAILLLVYLLKSCIYSPFRNTLSLIIGMINSLLIGSKIS